MIVENLGLKILKNFKMWIGRLCLFGWLSANISGFFMEPIPHRNYVAFLENKLVQASRNLPFGRYSVRN